MARKIPVLTTDGVKRTYGKFTYENIGGGRILIDPVWVQQNIVDCTLVRARNGQDVITKCHEKAKEPFERAFQMIADKGISSLIKTFDGLWVPRHQLWKNGMPLSRHSWGIAVDINADRNPYGGHPSPENLALNEVFNLFGFAWGGDWSPRNRDPMHWELARPDAWMRIFNPIFRSIGLILAVLRGDQWSYYRVKSAKFIESKREHLVDTLEVSRFLLRPGDRRAPASLHASTLSINEVIKYHGYEVVRIGNHLNDRDDPRLYIFVKSVS